CESDFTHIFSVVMLGGHICVLSPIGFFFLFGHNNPTQSAVCRALFVPGHTRWNIHSRPRYGGKAGYADHLYIDCSAFAPPLRQAMST
ncbi:MAG: hypothetical protein P8J90_10985, partial [Luminiphilus sp.]|nr:hypothetical protein [Luminiphilus sp.]